MQDIEVQHVGDKYWRKIGFAHGSGIFSFLYSLQL
jgi:hypothetical protein